MCVCVCKNGSNVDSTVYTGHATLITPVDAPLTPFTNRFYCLHELKKTFYQTKNTQTQNRTLTPFYVVEYLKVKCFYAFVVLPHTVCQKRPVDKAET